MGICKIKCLIIYFFSIYLYFSSGIALALNWTVSPSLNIEQTFSDNIKLTSDNKSSALVTEINPRVSLQGQAGVNNFDLNYQMQNIYNAGGDSGIDINNQLQATTHYQFVQNRLFLDADASISQQNTSNRQIANDNISGGDTTNVSTFRVSPYWTPHFKDYADGTFRVTYDRVGSDGGSSGFSDTNSFSQNILLNSGRALSRISWSLGFNNSYRSNSDGEDVSFQDSTALIRYAIGREFSVFARAGHSNNSFSTNSDSNQNGVFYTFGGQWKPSQRLRVEAGYGNNRFVTVEISPFRRVQWITTYSNNDIGLNSGETWNTLLTYNTRRSNWTVSYTEDTITTQQLLLEEQRQIGLFRNNQTNELFFADFITFLPTLTDEVFVTKNATLSYSFTTGKSDISANIFRIEREFELSGNDEEVTGVSANWGWKFIRRSTLNLGAGWQQTKSDGVDAFSDERFDVSLGITRNIASRLNGRIQYRFIDQKSDDNLHSYSENRITASLNYQF